MDTLPDTQKKAKRVNRLKKQNKTQTAEGKDNSVFHQRAVVAVNWTKTDVL